MADQNRTHKNGEKKEGTMERKNFQRNKKINQKLKIIIHPCQRRR
jgi:hypothetical protein